MKLLIRYLAFILLPVMIAADVLIITKSDPNKQGELSGQILILTVALLVINRFTKEAVNSSK